MLGCDIKIFDDGMAYVDFDDGQREMIDPPVRSGDTFTDYYLLEYLDMTKTSIRCVEADTEEELFKYMFDMVFLIHGPGMYYYDCNKMILVSDPKEEEKSQEEVPLVYKTENMYYYTSSTTFNPNEHADHFDPNIEEEKSEDEEEEEMWEGEDEMDLGI